MCDDIYTCNTHQKFKKVMDGHFSNLLRILKNGQKLDSFAAHFEQHFKSTKSLTELHKFMAPKSVNQLNLIGAMENFTKANCNIFMEERLTILKNLCDKRVMLMKKNSEA